MACGSNGFIKNKNRRRARRRQGRGSETITRHTWEARLTMGLWII